MNDDPVLAAVQKFMDAVESRLSKQDADIRSALSDLQTRAAQVGPGAPGKDGRDGAPGKDGENGEPGPAGKDGATGAQGDKGERGADGLQGREGSSGKDGKDGSPGERGPQGERGADGVQGRDGTPGVQGERGPQGEKGTDGLTSLEEINASVEKRAAEIQVRTFADLYQGVYEPNKLYVRGVLATWGGSLWLSLAETRAKPGENGEWKLVVKKGADGRK